MTAKKIDLTLGILGILHTSYAKRASRFLKGLLIKSGILDEVKAL